MFLLFIMHNVLNIRWYGNLFRGKYQFLRIIRTLINFAVFIVMICLMYSGIVMSRYVFAALPISSGMALARVMHLSGSYWGFVLMSIHLGLHWSVITGMFRKLGEGRNLTVISWIMRLFAIIIAGYGAFCFWQEDIASYLFLKVEFAFIDYEKNKVLVLLQNMTMMGLWVFIAYYMAKGIGKVSAVRNGRIKSNEGVEKIGEKITPFSGEDLRNMIVPLFLEQLLVMLVLHAGVAMGPAFITVIGQCMGNKDTEAAGDVKFTIYVFVLSTIAGRLFLSYLLGIVLNMGVIGIAAAMVCDWVIRGVIFIWRQKSGKWKEFEVV